MKVLTIIGARPQFIKAAVVSRAISEFNKKSSRKIEEVIVHTGQHYDVNMSDIFFKEMNIPKPHYNLGVGSGNHGEQTGKMLIELEKLLIKEKPDIALVYGDTNSTLAGALAASKLHIPIAHVEAGLRSFNKNMPEEINRVFTDHVSDILFCPTDTAVNNLANEGIRKGASKSVIVKTGDVMKDATMLFGNRSNDKWLAANSLRPEKYILATVHRAENTDSLEPLLAIITALSLISDKYYPVVFLIHPRTKTIIDNNKELQSIISNSTIKVIPPIGYIDMVAAEKNCRLIMTDSGGIQKEAFFHKKLCVILRNETEWVELVDSGWNRLTSLEPDKIVESVKQMLEVDCSKLAYPDLFGDGTAGEKIAEYLAEFCFR